MGKYYDLTGQRFGKLIVLRRNGFKQYKDQKHPLWDCQCDCDPEGKNIITVFGQSLRKGITTHCGCDYQQIIDLTGKVFGRLTVIGKSDKKAAVDRSQYWECECSCEDKTRCVVSAHNLSNGTTQSCSCLMREKMSEVGKKRKGSKRPDLYLEEGMSSFNALYGKYKREAEQMEREFNLTKENFKILTSGNCSYCGAEPSQILNRPFSNGDYLYNGIDRIDSSKGYVLGNCVSCCGRCNWMKREMSKDNFFDHIQKILKIQMRSWDNEKIEEFIDEIKNTLDKI